MQLDWDITDGESYIEGLYLFRLKDTEEMYEAPAYVINDATAMTFVVTQLQPDTNYTFFVIPFYGSVEGRPSNSKLVKTNQDGNKTSLHFLIPVNNSIYNYPKIKFQLMNTLFYKCNH